MKEELNVAEILPRLFRHGQKSSESIGRILFHTLCIPFSNWKSDHPGCTDFKILPLAENNHVRSKTLQLKCTML